MVYTFAYSDHKRKFQRRADELDIEVWEYTGGALKLNNPSPEAMEALKQYTIENNLVILNTES